MKIEVLKPIGYCNGVQRAIDIVKEARNTHKDKNIYIFGMLIHNSEILHFLDSINVKTLKNCDESINEIEPNSVVIFTAHGHKFDYETLLKEKGCVIYDAICPNVEKNLCLATKYQKQGYKILYIGDKNHQESKSFLDNISDVYLLDKEKLKNYYFSTSDKFVILNQTSLDFEYVNSIHNELKDYKNISFINTVCATSRARQDSLKHLDNDVDLIIVVGDKSSSNTNKLFKLATTLYPNIEAIFINTYKELDINLCKNKNHIVISSGASASKESVDMIIKYINENLN